MSRHKTPTIEQHQQFGTELKELRSRLQTVAIAVANAYPKTAKGPALLMKAVDTLDLGRFELENRVIAENPDAPDRALLDCYCGAPIITRDGG